MPRQFREPRQSGEVFNELRGESDRACGMIAGALLDELLLRLLRHAFIAEAPKDLFEYDGAAGSFSARINLAYSTGLITTEEHKNLHIIRRIRNDFGHSVMDQLYSFDTDTIRDRALDLTIVQFLETAPTPGEGGGQVTMMLGNELRTKPRMRFEFSVGLLAALLEERVNDIPKIIVRREFAENTDVSTENASSSPPSPPTI